MVTSEDISKLTGLSLRSVQRRLTDDYVIGQTSYGGRPAKLYDEKVLSVFNIKLLESNKMEINRTSARSQRSDSGRSRRLDEKDERDLIYRIKSRYLAQNQVNNLRRCVIEEVNVFDCEKYKLEPENFANYMYFKRIARSDARGAGIAIRENWRILHQEQWNKVEFNNGVPKLRYENLELCHGLGLIGEGYGSGTFWVIDGTQLDAWVTGEDGKTPILKSYLHVLDGITRFPLAFTPLENGETIEEVMKIILGCIELYGIPKYGFMLDNSRTFRSSAFRTFLEKMYSFENKKIFTQDWHKSMFYGSESPVKYPLPKMPSHSWKGEIESAFNQYNRVAAAVLPDSYSGQAKTMIVRHELGSVPTHQVQNALPFDVTWKKFITEIYTNFINNKSPQLNYAYKKFKVKPTRKDLFEFFGGIYEAPPAFNISLKNKIEPQRCHYKEYSYYLSDKNQRHEVKCELGKVLVSHETERRNYLSDAIGFELAGKKIWAVVDAADPTKAYLFDVWSQNRFSQYVSKEEPVYFIGEARDGTVRTEKDLKELPSLRQAVQKKVVAEIHEAQPGWRKPELEEKQKDVREIEDERDYKELDADISRFLDEL
jgi:hypothetical protein